MQVRNKLTGETATVVRELAIAPALVFNAYRPPRMHTMPKQWLVQLPSGRKEYWRMDRCEELS